ncbi:hypothetical protein CL620_06410 [archaeon]|nr:hypothetical protein [archaeon]
MSRLSWILPHLKKQFGGTFYITPAVKFELIDRPLTMNRFKFEALQVMKLIRDGVLAVYPDVPNDEVKRLSTIANNSFSMRGKSMDIIQKGEIESVICAKKLGASVVIDERTVRLFIERSAGMKRLLKSRFRRNVEPNQQKIQEFTSYFKGLTIIRSIELVSIAYKMKLLDTYIPNGKNGKNILVDSILWATKFNGCAVTNHEVEEISQFLLSKI